MLIKNTVPVKYSDEKKNLKINEFQEKLNSMENGNEFIINDIENREGKDKSLYIRMYHEKCNNEFHTTSSKFFNSKIADCPECHGLELKRSAGYESFREFISEITSNNFTENGEVIIIKDKKVVLPYNEDIQAPKDFRKILISVDNWTNKTSIIKGILINIIGTNINEKIYSSKCTIANIDYDLKNDFLEKFDILGDDNSEICFALIYTGANYSKHIVALMSFVVSERGFKISIFTTTNEKFVIGAFPTLLNTFKKNYEWSEIYVEPDMNWIDENKNIYLSNGFIKGNDNSFYLCNK